VFQAFRLFMHLVPGILQDIVLKQFQQTVMSNEFPRPALPGGCKANAAVLFIQHQGRRTPPAFSIRSLPASLALHESHMPGPPHTETQPRGWL